jgi:hypothetical protein
VTALADPYAARESRLLMAAVTDKKPSPEFSGRCIYCSARCYGRACGSHADLLLIEQQEYAA